MHPESLAYLTSVRARFPVMFTGTRVLEVGSLNINGSVRDLFTDCDYLGIDLGPGPGVDQVVPAHELRAPAHFDVVVTSEALEHDRHWKRSLARMVENLRPGGLLMVTCAGPARREHGTVAQDPVSSPHTLDYYRNLTLDDLRGALPLRDLELTLDRGGQDIYGLGWAP